MEPRDPGAMGAIFRFAASCEARKPSRYSTDDVVSLGSENMFGFLDFADINKLSQVIDARCRELNIRPDSIEAQMVASQLLEMFHQGITDESELSTRPIAIEIVQRDA